MTNLLSAKKVEDDSYKKLYPTINLLEDISIRSWLKLRKLLLNYGLKYYKRNEAMISTLILIFGGNCILFILSLANLI
jgi:hypothetical protein